MAGLFRQSAQTSFPLGAKTSLKPEDEAEAGISDRDLKSKALWLDQTWLGLRKGMKPGVGAGA